MKYTLITGASSGIGKELAKVFAKNGHSLILIARREALLEQLKAELENEAIEIILLPFDLTKDLKELFLKLDAYEIEVLINNSGMGLYAEFEKTELEDHFNMIDLNIKALLSLCHYYLKRFNKGHIINIASVASFVPGPYMASYYASKAFVLSFSEALKAEMNEGMEMTIVCPGPTTSEFSKVAKMEKSSLFNSIFTRSSKEVAHYTYSLYKHKKGLGIDGFFNKIGLFFVRFLPRSLVLKILKGIQGSTNTKI